MAAAALRCSVLTDLFEKNRRQMEMVRSFACPCVSDSRACDADGGTSNQSEGDSSPLHKAKDAISASE